MLTISLCGRRRRPDTNVKSTSAPSAAASVTSRHAHLHRRHHLLSTRKVSSVVHYRRTTATTTSVAAAGSDAGRLRQLSADGQLVYVSWLWQSSLARPYVHLIVRPFNNITTDNGSSADVVATAAERNANHALNKCIGVDTISPRSLCSQVLPRSEWFHKFHRRQTDRQTNRSRAIASERIITQWSGGVHPLKPVKQNFRISALPSFRFRYASPWLAERSKLTRRPEASPRRQRF